MLTLGLLMGGCGDNKQQIRHLSQLDGGSTFAVPTGTAADQFVLKKYPAAVFEYYNSVLDCAIAVKTGKADAAVYDLPVLKNIAAKNAGLLVLPELMFDDNYGFAFRLQDTVLKQVADAVLDSLKACGLYAEMESRWFPSHGNPARMPEIQFIESGEVLRFGTAAVTEPMSFYDSRKQLVGFDVEFASYVAQRLGMRLEVTDMEFGAMIPALIAGKVDMIGAGLSITEERAKQVLFTEPYYKSGIAVMVASGESSPEAADQEGKLMHGAQDLHNKLIGVLLGSIHDTYATKAYPDATILQYQNTAELVFALTSGKTDAVLYDHVSLPDIFKTNPGLGILAKDVFSVPIAAGFNSDNDAIREKFNEFLLEIRNDGTYDAMVKRWMEEDASVLPDIPLPGGNGVLRAGIVSDLGKPFSFISGGKLAGFDIELSKRFAARLGMEYEPVDLQFGSLIASISTGKIDIITSSMMITEEREKQIDFSEPYFVSGVSIIAEKAHIAGMDAAEDDATEDASPSFFRKVAESFYNNIIHEKRYQHILDGLWVTVLISVLAAILGTLIGAVVCLMRMSARNWIASTARGFINLIRGIPVLVLLMIIYYIVFASVNIDPVIVSVIAFGINFGAYVAEIFRSAVMGIDHGQRESASAMGFSPFQTFRHIIFPQALRPILPVYKGEFISLIKMTSIVGYIAVQDLTKASDIIRSRTFDAFFPLIMVAVLYFLVAWLLTLGLDYIEIRVNPKRKPIRNGKEVSL